MDYYLEYEQEGCGPILLIDPQTKRKFGSLTYVETREGWQWQLYTITYLLPTYRSLEAAKYRALAEFIEMKERAKERADALREFSHEGDEDNIVQFKEVRDNG